MPRKVIGPFPQFLGLSVVVPGVDPPGIVTARLNLMRGVLRAAGASPNGESRGAARDKDWSSDLASLMARTAPHEISTIEGNPPVRVLKTVHVRLETLRAEIDDKGEIMVWIYEES